MDPFHAAPIVAKSRVAEGTFGGTMQLSATLGHRYFGHNALVPAAGRERRAM
jgi:hypothetical protein